MLLLKEPGFESGRITFQKCGMSVPTRDVKLAEVAALAYYEPTEDINKLGSYNDPKLEYSVSDKAMAFLSRPLTVKRS